VQGYEVEGLGSWVMDSEFKGISLDGTPPRLGVLRLWIVPSHLQLELRIRQVPAFSVYAGGAMPTRGERHGRGAAASGCHAKSGPSSSSHSSPAGRVRGVSARREWLWRDREEKHAPCCDSSL
jgi:hypothetical protein